MPRRTVWVRDEDVDAFDSIQDRPTWLHNAIVSSTPAKLGPNERILPDGSRAIVIPQVQVNDEPHYEPVDDLP